MDDVRAKLKKIGDNIYEIPKTGAMRVPGIIFMNEKLVKFLDAKSVEQVMNVATLPGICKASYAMPDAHMGYGFTVGGVAAFDAKEGCISPGGVGYDINCGVRLLRTSLMKEEVYPKIAQLLDELFKRVPCGVGRGGPIHLNNKEFDELLTKGARWAVDHNMGNEEDLELCEESGMIVGAIPGAVSQNAYKRGKDQIGTLGAGNHFLEIQHVDKIFDSELARVCGITQEGQVVAMIHCGSRGLGHQVCSDYLRMVEKEFPDIMNNLIDRELAYAPVGSKLAEHYYGAMCAAANYAWCNRHIIGHHIRESFKTVLGHEDVHTVYDVAHNMAKLEEHKIDGEKRMVYVHRKGATRSFPPHHPALPERYQSIGQPVLIPGSMGTASYVLVGTETAMQLSLGSTAHGAGRTMSRHAAQHAFSVAGISSDLAKQQIALKAASKRGIVEEAPGAYKDIDEVVKVSHALGIGKLVLRLKPMGVVKG